MIRLTLMEDDSAIYIAPQHVMTVRTGLRGAAEVQMVSGKIYLVQESPEEVAQKVEAELNGTN